MYKINGFTLIELLVVISIIGLLAAVVLVSLNSARTKSRDARRLSDMHQLQNAMELFYSSCNGYPSTLATTANNGCPAGTTLGTFLAQIPVNPTPGGSTYAYTQTGSGTGYTVTFTLEGQVNNLASGLHTASPSGVQ